MGGLLWASVGSANYAPTYDGNGNIIAWLDLAAGTKVAENDYDAFGNVIHVAGTNPTPFGFSTKYTAETGLLYYGYRYYAPSTGRFINRDPAEEMEGGVNLYAMASNDALNHFDMLGLWSDKEHYALIRSWLIGRNSKLPAGSTYVKYKWHCIEINVYRNLLNGNDDVDGTGSYAYNFSKAQAVENSYQHGMRAPGQSVSDAQSKMYAFIFNEVQQAKRNASEARVIAKVDGSSAKYAIERAIHFLGRAQHPIADTTSPQHHGFQLWAGLVTPSALAHHLNEDAAEYAAQGGNPVRVVSAFFDGFLDEILAE